MDLTPGHKLGSTGQSGNFAHFTVPTEIAIMVGRDVPAKGARLSLPL